MQIVITEAASTLAYHLIQQIASGDIIQNQSIDLVLCDNASKQDILTGVAYEVEDCVYPAVSSVRTSTDLCGSFKTADVALILPKPTDERVPKDVEIEFTELKQIDFHVLDGVFHPTDIMKQDPCRFRSQGTIPTAVLIAGQLQEYHQSCLRETEKCTSAISYHEEAEFGMADYTQVDSVTSPWLGSMTAEQKVVLMLITSNNSVLSDDCCKKEDELETDGQLLLSRL